MSLAEFASNPKAVNPRIVSATKVKLGKKPKKDDKRNLQLREYIEAEALPPIPVRSFYGYKVENYYNKIGEDPWPMYGNDYYPNCTCATVGHEEELFSASADDPEKPTKASVMEIFDATGPRNEGRYCTEILNYWRNTGFGPDREKIFAYAEVDPLDIPMVKAAMHLFGGVYLGIALPITAQHDDERWVFHSGAPANEKEPGSWGGHAVNTVGFSDYDIWLITWGEKIRMSWAFWKHYVDEVYAVLSPDWFKDSGLSMPGFNKESLLSDLNDLNR